MLKMYKNSKKQGDAGMGIAIGWFCGNGYNVSIPLTDSQDYDLVVEINNILKKVQVKTTTYKKKSNIYQVFLKTCGGNKSGTGKTKLFNWESSDYLFIVTSDEDKYIIPTFPSMPKNTLNLGEQYQQYKV